MGSEFGTGIPPSTSNKYVEVIDGYINFYERGYDGNFRVVRAIRKRQNGSGMNNTVINLKTHPIYGTKTDWFNTTTLVSTKELIYERDDSNLVWAEVDKINDNEFRLKCYEKLVQYTTLLNQTFGIDPGYGNNGSFTTATRQATTEYRMNFQIKAEMEEGYGTITEVIEDGYCDIRIYRNGQLYSSHRLFTHSSAYNIDNTYNYSKIVPVSSGDSVYAVIHLNAGRYRAEDLFGFEFFDYVRIRDGAVQGLDSNEVTHENNSTLVYFDSEEGA